ncbi:unnamed protein product [Moneuplotes crassus]|uniref:Uncharacterized protein n=1 Tax=Euplotes crassus TaxID=5936 RepID=A0AAD1XKM5_EUPCR|nr:unnamed protein product [Moneuplotes crassus]
MLAGKNLEYGAIQKLNTEKENDDKLIEVGDECQDQEQPHKMSDCTKRAQDEVKYKRIRTEPDNRMISQNPASEGTNNVDEAIKNFKNRKKIPSSKGTHKSETSLSSRPAVKSDNYYGDQECGTIDLDQRTSLSINCEKDPKAESLLLQIRKNKNPCYYIFCCCLFQCCKGEK